MRQVNFEISIPETQIVTVTKIATTEDFSEINESKLNKKISVTILFMNEANEVLQTEIIEIIDEKYELLMSESPDFAIGKPFNEYREEDLWHIVDLIRSEREQQ
jgi:hypothetical protein